MTTKNGTFKLIRLIVESPRSHTELMHLTGQYDERVRRTLRALQEEKLIAPVGNRTGETGRPQLLYGWKP